jgi:hypothetical protein
MEGQVGAHAESPHRSVASAHIDFVSSQHRRPGLLGGDCGNSQNHEEGRIQLEPYRRRGETDDGGGASIRRCHALVAIPPPARSLSRRPPRRPGSGYSGDVFEGDTGPFTSPNGTCFCVVVTHLRLRFRLEVARTRPPSARKTLTSIGHSGWPRRCDNSPGMAPKGRIFRCAPTLLRPRQATPRIGMRHLRRSTAIAR